MERITREHLDGQAATLNREIPGNDYSIEWAYGRPRLVAQHESRDISPRLSKGELYDWIWAYIAGARDYRDNKTAKP